MNNEIKRLLKLSAIPGFQLTATEIETLKEWKKTQKSVKPAKKVKQKAPEGFKVDEQIGDAKGPAIVPVEDSEEKAENRKKEIKTVKNIVKDEQKETGKIEEA